MDKEQLQAQSRESQAEEIEKNISPEKTVEETREEMTVASEKEVAGFENEGKKGLQGAEQKAETDGFAVSAEDKTELQELDREAEAAKGGLMGDIGGDEDMKQEQKATQESVKIKNICSGCGREGKEGHNFCEECGKKMESIKACPGCGKENKAGNKFCEDCGNKFEKNETTDQKGEQQQVNIFNQQSVELHSETNIFQSNNALEERKIVSHEGLSEKELEEQKRTVEDTILRNNAFIVHKIADHEKVRHNENSDVSDEATYEDDIDIMLSLEPSISASSVTPGKKANLWPGTSGFLLGGGKIGEASTSDGGTRAHGIKSRGGENSSIEEIDRVVGRNHKDSKQDYEKFGYNVYNEFVVNDSEVAGFFQNAEQDEKGRFWAYDLKMKEQYKGVTESPAHKEMFEGNISKYKKRFAVASERGIPLYIMTPDRLVYECMAVNDDGTIEVGKQITPEDIAKGRVGLPDDKRKEIGERLLNKKIFREDKIQKEAEEIIEAL